ncbi:protein PIN-LIKES 6 isoform X1 [Rosa chinensis]|uniref:protein PIN-LIKES 6 isoform X1 n=1 Tax=Rosa chinensis TaxID=74649 RepID=UPI000D0923FB|nr:protein PIN-LIKES 6 isoform X1 [Rosa chinensis]XP_024196582.1 protein PIN-LIKES 6 isoform X1 [Rosa chinensis]XP_024196583.1 protein PIN-LIKES 6 isoform X1 [Rosa chinensis]
MLEWWFIPTNAVLGSISDSIIGYITASIVRPPYPYFKFTIVQIGIGNIGNVPLVLIAALCRDSSNPFGDSTTCSTNGTAYILFGQVGAIILYTYVFHMLAPPPDGTFDIDEETLPIKSPSDGETLGQVPLLTPEDKEEKEEQKNEEQVVEVNSNSSKKSKVDLLSKGTNFNCIGDWVVEATVNWSCTKGKEEAGCVCYGELLDGNPGSLLSTEQQIQAPANLKKGTHQMLSQAI